MEPEEIIDTPEIDVEEAADLAALTPDDEGETQENAQG